MTIRLEVRPAPSRLMIVLSPVAALAVTVLVAGILFLILGKDPVRGLDALLVQPNVFGLISEEPQTVSYTHLTLPTTERV